MLLVVPQVVMASQGAMVSLREAAMVPRAVALAVAIRQWRPE